MSRWRFKPPLWAWLLTAAGVAAMTPLGFWQWHRGEAKEALVQRYLEADAASLRPLAGDEVAAAEVVQKRSVQGSYLPERQLLLDNQSLRRRPGYHVWTPLRRDDGSLVMVNRGWIAAGPDRAQRTPPPAPQGRQEVSGFWRPLPRPGLQVEPAACQAQAFPQLVQYPQHEDLACLYPGERLADGLLLLAPQEPGGFERVWTQVFEVPPEKHYGYALQWWAFALTAVVLFIKLNLKRR